MPRSAIRLARAIIVLGFAFALSSCVVGPPDGYYGSTVAVAPPVARAEYYGPAPYPGYVWIAGYWNWAPTGYVWVRGRWAPPRPGFRYVPHRWVHMHRGWRLTGGRWVRRHRR